MRKKKKNVREAKEENKFPERWNGKHFKCYMEMRTEKYPLKIIIGKNTHTLLIY